MVVQVEGGKIVTAASVLTNVAVRGCLGVDEVGSVANALQVIAKVGCTSLTLGRIECCKLGVLAVNLSIEGGEDEERTHKVVVRVKVVLPVTPEGLNLVVRGQDTTKRYENTDDQRVNERSEDCVRSVGGDELTDTSVDELVDQHDKVDRARGRRA